MTNFKGTKGKWNVDPITGMIKCDHQGIASTWSMETDDLDERLNGESWLDMRHRTQAERDNRSKVIPKANALLISKSPQMLEMLDRVAPVLLMYGETDHYENVLKLIKEATSI